MEYKYEKLDENYRKQYCPLNDYDGKITGTGHCIIGLKAWFDENEAERKRLGWVKHLYYKDVKEMQEDYPEYNPTLHYAVQFTEVVDEYTVKDSYRIIVKSEDMMEMEEMLESMNIFVPTGTMIVDSMGGAII